MKHYPWSEVYRVALLELDRTKITERVSVARKALKSRIGEIPPSASAELRAIEAALNGLSALESTEIRGKAQSM